MGIYRIVNALELEYSNSNKIVAELTALYSEKAIYKYMAKESSDKYANGDIRALAMQFVESSNARWISNQEFRYFIFKENILVGLIGFDRKSEATFECWFLKSACEPAIMSNLLPELLEEHSQGHRIIATVDPSNSKSIALLTKLNFIKKEASGSEMLYVYTGIKKVVLIPFITKGLADISLNELSQLPGYKLISCNEKRIKCEAFFLPALFKKLLTVDDLVLDCTKAPIINAINLIKKFRKIDNTFSITVSSYKTKQDIKSTSVEELKQKIEKEFGFSYVDKLHTNLDFRLILDSDAKEVGLKIFPESIYVRDYGHESDIGALRSTIAASIIMHLKNKCDGRVLFDPMCGTGTFLCEGITQGLVVCGSDINENKVKIAKQNTSKLGKKVEVQVHNAEIPFQTNLKPDMIVTNVPWGKQISNKISISKVVENFKEILISEGSISVLCMDPNIWKKEIKKCFPTYMIETRKVGYIGQSPTVIFAYLKR